MNGITDGVALVTGGSSGIGRAAAQRFGAEGAQVVVADLDTEGGEETVAQIEQAGGDAVFVEANVVETDDIAAMVEATVDTYGGLDFAFNNAGIEGTDALSHEQSFDDWQRVIDINLKGVFAGMREQLPVMLEHGGGAIVNTASIAGLTGFPNLAPYVASKHGVIGLTKTAAKEFGREGVRVNTVCPGVIETPMVARSREENPETTDGAIQMTPMGRLGKPEEIGDAVVWLCSTDASFVTGESLVVDGGFTA